jgi:hypothetical protein
MFPDTNPIVVDAFIFRTKFIPTFCRRKFKPCNERFWGHS